MHRTAGPYIFFHKPAYLNPRWAGGMSAMLAIVSDFAALQRKAPVGQESNWLFTPAGKGWWPWFRFYGPEQALFNKTWKLSDIERV